MTNYEKIKNMTAEEMAKFIDELTTHCNHIEEVDNRYKKYPMYIHLDLSLNTDKTGISGICQSGRKDIDMPDNKTMSQ